MDNKAIEILGEENAELLLEFTGKIQGKTLAEAVNVLLEFKARLPKDKIFTNEEREFIIKSALSNTSEEDKARFAPLLKMLKIT